MKLISNQSGEVFLIVALMIFAVGSAVTISENEKSHKKQMHYEQYHKEMKLKQQLLEEALKKAKLYRI